MSASVPTFGAQVLAILRADGYQPAAWVRFLGNSWEQSRATARDERGLVTDWRGITLGLSALAMGATSWTGRRHGARVAARAALPLALATLAQAVDLYAHLGLHRAPDAPSLDRYARLGAANALSASRGLAASWIWTRQVAGVPLDDTEFLAAVTLIVATDIADGAIARHDHLVSRLGAYLDVEADLFAWVSIVLTQMRRGDLPPWFAALILARWLAPAAVGLTRSFGTAAPVALGAQPLGKLAGGAQIAASAVAWVTTARADHPDARRWHAIKRGTLVGAGIILGMATFRQLTRLIRR